MARIHLSRYATGVFPNKGSAPRFHFIERQTTYRVGSYGIVMTSAIVTDQFLQKVLQTSIETRNQCSELLNFVEATPVSPSKALPIDIQLELSKRQKLLYSYLSILRGLNRDAILKVRGTKQTTAEARQEIDRLHLQLQNLYYEERHLRGEIAACESYEFEPLHRDF